MYVCGSDDTCGPDVDGFSVASVFENFRGDVAERAGEGGELLIGGMGVFWAVEDEHRRGRWTGDVHSNVGVRGAVEDVLGSATSVKGERKAHLRSLDDSVAVKVVDGGKDAVKELAAGSEFKDEAVLGLRLETLVKFDLR